MSSFIICHVTDSDVAQLCDTPGARLRAVGGDVALLRHSCSFGACHDCCGQCLAVVRCGWWWPLVTVVSEVGRCRGQWWWLRKSGVVC